MSYFNRLLAKVPISPSQKERAEKEAIKNTFAGSLMTKNEKSNKNTN